MSFWKTLSEIVRTLLIMSATGSIIALLLFVLKLAIKNHLPKNAQYYLWVLALIAFLVPFSVFVSLPFATPMTPVQTIIETNVKSTVEWQNQVAMELYGVPYAQLDDLEQVNVSYREFKARNIGNYNFLLNYILILGAEYLLKELVQYNIYLFKLKRRRLPARKSELNLLPERGSRLFRNPLATTPMLVGLFRPAIYLPDREYSEKQLQNIMLHELTHWRRHDIVIKWIAAITVCMHWFNPLAYFARREIDRACELSCDEAVINNLNNEDKQSYGDTLIEMASDVKSSRIIVSTTMCEEKKALKERLSAIMKSKKLNKATVIISCALLVVVLCGIVLLGASTYQKNIIDAKQAELLSAMRENVVPNGLGLEITAAALDDAEFLLVNTTESIVEYGYANRVERYVDGAWEAAISETKAIYPENPKPLQVGQRMYGMTAWVRDNTELAPGTYRYLMLVNVREGDLPAYPVVLEAPFEITE
mgnify:FL=1